LGREAEIFGREADTLGNSPALRLGRLTFGEVIFTLGA